MAELCEVCGEGDFKYKCPKCLKKSCSLACSRKHKANDDCSGIAHDPTVYIASAALKEEDDETHEMNVVVQRDYNFLTQMKRVVELQKRDGKLKNKRTLNLQYGGGKRPRYNESASQRVIRRGVNCLVLPKGMQRSVMNKSKWDKALDLFVWSVEWVLFPTQDSGLEPFVHVSHRIKETDSIAESMGKVIYDKCSEFYHLERPSTAPEEGQETKEERTSKLVGSGLLFYTKWFPYNTVDVVDSRKLVRLEASGKSIAELFRNKTVIEFPTIFVAKQEADMPRKYTIVNEDVPREVPSATVAADESSSDEPPEESCMPSQPKSKPTADDSDSDSDGYDPGVTMDFLAN